MYFKDRKSSEGDGIDSEEAKRSPLLPNFSLFKGNQRNLGITAIRRTIRNQNGHLVAQLVLMVVLLWERAYENNEFNMNHRHLDARMIVWQGIIREDDCSSQADVRRDDNHRQVLLFETTDVVYNHSK
ncbi:hypothetical protein [Paenibacillus amylolyticus]|uniref:hypothetical protein n=1 Tax=Paenibacillus amylolyticus TaxID=1451 RepID=UPI003D998EBD